MNRGVIAISIFFFVLGMAIAGGYIQVVGTTSTTTTSTSSTGSSTTSTFSQSSVTASSSITQSSATTTAVTTCSLSSSGCMTTTSTTQTTIGSTGTVDLDVYVQECSFSASICYPVSYPQIIVQKGGVNVLSCAADVNGFCSIPVPANYGSISVCYAAGTTIIQCDSGITIGTSSPVTHTITFSTSGFSVIGVPCTSNCSALVAQDNGIIGVIFFVMGALVLVAGARKK